VGVSSLSSVTTGHDNTALGFFAGINATTGSHNVFIGSNVSGNTSDANTIRIGKAYSGGTGQNQTFIAGIRDTSVSGGYPVIIDANGQLGTAGGFTGNVGIGTSSPQTALHLYSGSVALARMRFDSGSGIYSEMGTDSAAPHFGAGIFYGGTQQAHFYGGGLSLGTYTVADPPANGLIVSGNEGIGTTTPQTALHL